MKSDYSQDLNEKLSKTKTLEEDLTSSKHQLLVIKVRTRPCCSWTADADRQIQKTRLKSYLVTSKI